MGRQPPASPWYARDEAARRTRANERALAVIGDHRPDVLLTFSLTPLDVNVIASARAMGALTALWFVEDVALFPERVAEGAAYDAVFAMGEREGVRAFREAGAREVHVLPTAAPDDRLGPVPLAPDEVRDSRAAISFIGKPTRNRVSILRALLDWDIAIWGHGWLEEVPLWGVDFPVETALRERVRGRGRWVADRLYARIAAATDLALNIHSSITDDGLVLDADYVNPHLFAWAACGCAQLVDRRRVLDRYFDEGCEVVAYSSVEELRERAQEIMADPPRRTRLAANARVRVLAEHTYRHRVRALARHLGLSGCRRRSVGVDSHPCR
jgi:spore maturation protein CgeB